MKTCADRRGDLADLVFGELDDRAEIELNEHLLTCAACREEERSLLALRSSAAADRPPLAPDLRARIRSALEAHSPPLRLGVLGRPVPGYVALAAGLLGALLVAAMPDRAT